MHVPSYPFKGDESHLVYYFESVNSQEVIKKVVQFTEIHVNIFNLFLGDVDESGVLSDSTISNNKDMEKVLATVCKIMVEFLQINSGCFVYFTGSDVVRTRLYRIAITNYKNDFEDLFVIFGVVDNEIEKYQINRNYDGFLIGLRES